MRVVTNLGGTAGVKKSLVPSVKEGTIFLFLKYLVNSANIEDDKESTVSFDI